MQVTLEMSEELFGRIKDSAAAQGVAFEQFVAEAMEQRLTAENKPWMASVGKLRHLREDLAEVDRVIEDEFERVDPEQWK